MSTRRLKIAALVVWVASFCIVPLAFAGKTYDGGFWPFMASCCIGPRVGQMMNEGTGVRDLELFSLLPPVFIVTRTMMAIEAGQGKTFSEIAADERLGGPCGPPTALAPVPVLDPGTGPDERCVPSSANPGAGPAPDSAPGLGPGAGAGSAPGPGAGPGAGPGPGEGHGP